ncbi:MULTISPECIES: slipin family protein [unclassified Beijerinckia]|uniref:slipin family protein n=1 Tax=unclassified Beijerinckia TaxID=2638183 RepID=UPI000894BF1E|nr:MULTISPECIES: slipin family protein [unclassified Beijerinckia]MDH7796800.1 regulator of protease activity HflC (stomatin/prohibitin superfamily) [Beijerinckia sp. GAS462]SEC60340.1 SPFH domain, Band 7 family protein [Beijerinckia sp. 28-YEA-48]
MAKLLDKILGRKHVLVKENERIVALHKGELLGVYGPGIHHLPNRQNSLEFVRCDLTNGVFVSIYEHALFDKLPDVANQHLTVFRTAAAEIVVIERDGAIFAVMRPNQKLIVWNDAGPWAETRIDVSDSLAVDPTLMRRIVQVRKTEALSMHLVNDGQVGLLSIDGKQVGELDAGMHGFWNVGKGVQVKVIDQKWQALDVTGQELLTRDRVTIRINIAAEYRVVDPVKAVNEVKDFTDALYRALQVVFRRTLGNLTLDQILASKVTINEEAAGKVRENMAAIGIEISNIELKDVILPGEMREILNQVVTAEKQAEANVIRRREETNATRSLLNTAKVMAENPVMLRLKELEALEAIAGKVERLTIHNGTGGLMNDLVKLRD